MYWCFSDLWHKCNNVSVNLHINEYTKECQQCINHKCTSVSMTLNNVSVNPHTMNCYMYRLFIIWYQWDIWTVILLTNHLYARFRPLNFLEMYICSVGSGAQSAGILAHLLPKLVYSGITRWTPSPLMPWALVIQDISKSGDDFAA